MRQSERAQCLKIFSPRVRMKQSELAIGLQHRQGKSETTKWFELSSVQETFDYVNAFYKYRIYTERRQAIAIFSLLFIYTHIFFFYIVLNDEFFCLPVSTFMETFDCFGLYYYFLVFLAFAICIVTARMETTKKLALALVVYMYTKMELLLYTFRVIIFIIPTFLLLFLLSFFFGVLFLSRLGLMYTSSIFIFFILHSLAIAEERRVQGEK